MADNRLHTWDWASMDASVSASISRPIVNALTANSGLAQFLNAGKADGAAVGEVGLSGAGIGLG